ncbi:MAG TPA: DUF4390 domain-containing protein [Gemmatimonadaceae bacterium]|nr:DUF4390 domain-containing protein [Gemmatimonadaceae bacterium]
MRTRALVLALAAMLAARSGAQTPAAAPAAPPEPAVDVILPAPEARGTQPPAVSNARMLEDRTTRELLHSGFPARLHFRVELWEAKTLFDKLVTAVEWDVIVRYDPLARHYTVTRIAEKVTPLGTFAELKDAQEMVSRPFVPDIAPPTDHKRRYYYFASLTVEMLSVTDIDEVQRWLRGEGEPMVQGKQNAGTALGRGLQTLFTRMLGGQVRTYHARSAVFRP